jgi:hypothetical protein
MGSRHSSPAAGVPLIYRGRQRSKKYFHILKKTESRHAQQS